jgi:hypothetical protein
MKPGTITTQTSAWPTGKTTRARAWEAESPDTRRVVEGDRREAERLAAEGYDVMLNLNE